jgi:hypothetical protein
MCRGAACGGRYATPFLLKETVSPAKETNRSPWAIGALRKRAGGTFLATDRSGYAARREL